MAHWVQLAAVPEHPQRSQGLLQIGASLPAFVVGPELGPARELALGGAPDRGSAIIGAKSNA